MITFREAQKQHDNESDCCSPGFDDSDSIQQIVDDETRVSELIGNMDHVWLADAVAHAYRTGDWLYVGHQTKRHLGPVIRELAEAGT